MSPPSHHSSSPKIMVFRPTLEEMKDFPAYIAHMESMGAHKAGIAKIIPPKEFVAAYDYDDIESRTIPAPIQQEVMGHQGLYTQYNIQKKPLSYQEFKKLANSSRYATPSHFDYDDLERKYWKNITYNPPIYGADISGSLYSKGCDIWNINKLNTLLDVIEEEQGVKIEGVNTAYLYFGMWKTTFAWHTEDMDLYSINYLHFGAPKSWYGIPPEHAKRLERLAAGFFPQSFQICPNFLRHKMTLISPQILKKYSIPYDKITQETGEFMITFPYGYHAGYNHGFNCAESTNFASLRWIDFGKRAKCCSCQKDSVKINMDPFIRIFQPHRYETWKAGEDVVYIEDLDKPSSGIQSQSMLQHQSPKSMANEVALKTRRQPLHKRDGRRTKAGTTSHGKHSLKNDTDKTKKAQTFQEISPSVSIPVFKINIESVETTSQYFEVNDSCSSLSQTLQGDAVSGKEEPVVKGTLLNDLSHKITEISTQKEKKKKSKSTKRDSKLKKKHSHSNGDVSSTLRNDTEAKRRHAKSKKKHSKSKKDCTKSNQKEGILKDSEKRSSQCQEENKRQDHLDIHECSGPLSSETNLKLGGSKEISTKSGLLLEKERSDKKRKSKAKKTGLLKLKEVNREPAYSNSSRTKSSSSCKDKNKGKRKTLKLDTLFGKSKRVKLMDIPREMHSNPFHDVSQTEKDVNKQTDELTDASVAAGKLSRPTLGKAGVTDKTAQTRKTKHDFTSQEFSAMKAWARSMNGLWVTQPHSYDMELAYNLSIADQRPGCCVCMLFYNEKIDGKDWDKKSSCWTSVSSEAALSSQGKTFVLTPEICFAATSENRFPDCLNDSLTDEGHSLLLNCSQCKIAVHASCYGASVTSPDMWKCKRCEEQDYLAECCLCNLRGGALKHTTNGRWAHIVCAMAIPEVLFEDVKARDSINIENISPARLKLKCFFCRPFIKMGNKYGGLIQCSVGRCALAFHVTCAQAAGVIMEPCDWPFAVYATCLRHPFPDKMKDKPRDFPLKNVSVSEAVISKHKNGRYYRSEIIGEHQQVFLHVKFDDGSYSENLYPQDIENYDCMNDGLPDEGAAVQVRWTDGLVYKGTFVSSYMVKLFDVEFEDRSVSRVKREDIYSHEEPLPKKVRTKLKSPKAYGIPTNKPCQYRADVLQLKLKTLNIQCNAYHTAVQASDMRHENFLESKVVTDRHRHVCSLYASNLEASNDMMISPNAAVMLCSNNTPSETTEGSSKILYEPQEEDHHTSPDDQQGLNTILIDTGLHSEDVQNDQQQSAPKSETQIFHELKEKWRLECDMAENNKE